MDWLTPPYNLKREDSKDARFYWMKLKSGRIKKFIGITSLGSLCIPDSRELVTWQILKDPDGRLLELSAKHGELEHIIIDKLDRGEEWKPLLKDYKYERNILGASISWLKFCKDYKVEIIASELMLKWKRGRKRFACTLDKVAWITIEKKQKKVIEDGIYQRGANRGKPKFKEITEIITERKLVIIDLKSNFFEKDSKSFYESHLFQLWGQRLAFMQTFPDMPIPGIYNWSPTNWRARTNGNLENTYTFYEWKKDYHKQFELHLRKAWLERWFEPEGKIEVFMDFNKSTSLEDAYKVFSYDEYINYKEAEGHKKMELENLNKLDLNSLMLMVDKEEIDNFLKKFNLDSEMTTELIEDEKTKLRDFLIDIILKHAPA